MLFRVLEDVLGLLWIANFTLRLKTILSLATSGVLIMMLSGEKLLKVEVLGLRQSESCFD